MANKTEKHFPLPKETMWFAVLVSEFIVIFIINAFTLIIFARNGHLRKRSTYLIINLTVADLLVGAVTGPLELCYEEIDLYPDFNWETFSVLILYNVFIMSSLCSLSLISLERLHASLYPLRHLCLILEGAYFKAIFCSWLIALLFASVDSVVYQYKPVASYYLWTSLIVLTLLVLIIAYAIIVVKIKGGPPFQTNVRSVASERKLSITLFIVTVVSILTILPWAVWAVIPFNIWNELSELNQIHISYGVLVLYYACSLVNPLIYAIRMQEFRTAVYKQLTCKKASSVHHVQPIELHAMPRACVQQGQQELK